MACKCEDCGDVLHSGECDFIVQRRKDAEIAQLREQLKKANETIKRIRIVLEQDRRDSAKLFQIEKSVDAYRMSEEKPQ